MWFWLKEISENHWTFFTVYLFKLAEKGLPVIWNDTMDISWQNTEVKST